MISVIEINELPRPIAENEIGHRKFLIQDFLFDARNSIDLWMSEIAKAEENENIKAGLFTNQVNVTFYKSKATIEHLWVNENGITDEENLASTEIPLSEAKQLLLDWQTALKKWRAENSE